MSFVDETPMEEDGMRSLVWDLPVTWPEFYDNCVFHAEQNEGIGALPDTFMRHFLTLPAATPMPPDLRATVEEFLRRKGEDRDAMRPRNDQ